jgi:hypothetical protein
MKKYIAATAGILLLLGLIWNLQVQKQSSDPTTRQARMPARQAVPRLKLGVFELPPQSASPQTVAASVGEVDPDALVAVVVPLAPRFGKSYSLTPRLFWRVPSSSQQTTVQLHLWDSEMNRWKWEVTGTEFQIHSDEVNLQPGATYGWLLESPVGQFSEIHEFVIVGGTEREQIEEELARVGQTGNTLGQLLGRGRLFAESGLWYDAVEAYSVLIEKFPNRAELYQERAQILAELPVTHLESQQDAQKAEALLAVPPNY